MNAINQWVINHLALMLGTSTLIGAAAAWVGAKLPAFLGKEFGLFDAKLLSSIKNPAVKGFVIKVEQAIEDAVPDAGDAKYAALTELIVAEIPGPNGAAARPLVLAVLTALGAGAKSGIAQGIQLQPPPALPDPGTQNT